MKKPLGFAAAFAALVATAVVIAPRDQVEQPVGFVEDWPSDGGFYQESKVPAQYEQKSIVFTINKTDDNASWKHNQDKANANTVYELTTDAPEFAWAVIKQASPDTSFWFERNTNRHAFIYHTNVNSSGQTAAGIDWLGLATDTAPTVHLMYLDFLKYIPANVTITKAKINFLSSTAPSGYLANNDSMSATLMTVPGDTIWYRNKGVDSGETDHPPGLAQCSWNNQAAQDIGPVFTNPVSADTVWTPALGDRAALWDWGDYHDWSWRDLDATGADSVLSIDITDCVQAAVNGATNNGIMFTGWDYGNTANSGFWWGWWIRNYETYGYKWPWIEVEYYTKPYTSPFPGGSDFAFVFTTDDAVKGFNRVCTDTFRSRGVAYTIFAKGLTTDTIPTPDAYANAETLLAWHDDGMEIGVHSYRHYAQTENHPVYGETGGGWNYFDPRGRNIINYEWSVKDPEALPEGSSGWDSLLADTSPLFLYAAAFDNGHSDSLRSDKYWGKTAATPVNEWNQYVIEAMAYHGFKAMRAGEVGKRTAGGDGYLETGALATYDFGADSSDTLRAWGVCHDPLRPYNMIGLPYTTSIFDLVGQDEDDPSQAEVEFNIKNAILNIRGSGRGVVSTFSHALKSDAYGLSAYDDGIDGDELAWILDVVIDEGGWVARARDFADWRTGKARVLTTPSSYSQPDSFDFASYKNVWYKPNGLNNRFIPEYPATTDISGNLQDLTVAQSSRLGIAFPGNSTSVDYLLMAEIGIGAARINANWSSTWSNSTLSANVVRLDSMGIAPVITFVANGDSVTASENGGDDSMPQDLAWWHAFVKKVGELLDDDGTDDIATDLNNAVTKYMILNEWTERSSGWTGTYLGTESKGNIIAFIDTTKDALSSAAGAELIIGSPSAGMADFLVVGEEYADYDVSISQGDYTAAQIRADADRMAKNDTIIAVYDRAQYDVVDIHQYGPAMHGRLRAAYFDSMWAAGLELVSTEAGGPSYYYEDTITDLDLFDQALEINLDAFANSIPYVLWLKLFDNGTESTGNDDVPMLEGDGFTVTKYRGSWYGYKVLALVFENASTCSREEDGVYKLTLASGKETWVLLHGRGDGLWTVPAGLAPRQAIYIEDPANGSYTLGAVPGPGEVVNHLGRPVVISEALLIE